MTVGELIQRLDAVPPELPVCRRLDENDHRAVAPVDVRGDLTTDPTTLVAIDEPSEVSSDDVDRVVLFPSETRDEVGGQPDA